MNTIRTKISAAIIIFAAALAAGPVSAETPGIALPTNLRARTSCARTHQIAMLRSLLCTGSLLENPQNSKFNLSILAKQTDAFIERCLDNPNEKAMDAMAKVKN